MSKLYPLLGLLLVLPLTGCPGEKAVHAQDSAPAKPDAAKVVKFDPKSLERLGIKVEAAGSTSGSLDLEVPGSLEYNLDKYAEVGTLVDGRLTSITVKPGDSVKRGQVLATLVVPSIANRNRVPRLLNVAASTIVCGPNGAATAKPSHAPPPLAASARGVS